MRILVLSDLHYKLPHYDWLVEASGRVDAVGIVGDLADVVSPVPHDVQTVVVAEYLADWIEEHRPDMVLCGHIHQSPWASGGAWHARVGDTWVFNAGKAIGPVPSHITLDTEAMTADWFGVYESELLALD